MNGKVFATLNQGLSAYDAETGKLLWRNGAIGGKWDWGSSVVPWTKNGKSYLISGNGHCVDPDSGKDVWVAQGITASCVFPAIFDDTAIFFGANIQAYKLTPEKAELLWSKPGNSGDRVSSPVVFQDYVYTSANGGTRCLNLKTGEVVWEEKAHRTMFCMPILADGKIFAACDDGGNHGHDNYWPSLFCFKATPEKFVQLGITPKDVVMAYCSSPAIANGKLYLHQLDCIACYDLTAK
jgi:outer membrane protein assembly factor BamB